MSIFACPACGGQLNPNEKTFGCANGHSYDIASEGYVYLLPPNKKHSKMPGDDKQMVASRRKFLESGYYALFSDALNELTLKYLPRENPVVLDAGCGEGYYTGRLSEFLESHSVQAGIYGFDISKFAVKAAAKKYRNISFAVGSMFGIPVLDESADLVTNVFAPIVPEELNRVTKPGGVMIIAVPGEEHLFGLKKILYENPYENEHRETEYAGFTFLERVAVQGEIHTTDPEVMQNLFTMTPYYWKTPKEGCEKLKEAESLDTGIEFDFLVYRKTSNF
ncbi:MAG TPA: methyltransferase domain-containing protein [Caproicibacter sp.]|nr:methyltransferase domain-containing protein [Caproicibacter sp.]